MDMGNRDTIGRRILIVGGTTEARELAGLLVDAGYEVITSLAGRTDTPRFPAGIVRIGGFGGKEGLARYIRENCIDLLIRLERPAWKKPEGATWIEVGTAQDAADALPRGARVLLTVGRQELGPFLAYTGCHYTARMIEVPAGLPDDWRVIAARGPFTLEDELHLMQERGITHLVTKNSGGTQVAGKLEAAVQLSIPIIVIKRPRLPKANAVDSVVWAHQSVTRIFRTG